MSCDLGPDFKRIAEPTWASDVVLGPGNLELYLLIG